MIIILTYFFRCVIFVAIGVFFGFQIFHLGTEWITYPLRASERFTSGVESLENRLPLLKGVLMPNGTDRNDWLEFISLDFGIRCTVMIVSSVGMLLLLLVIDYVPWVTNMLSQSGYTAAHTFLLILVSVVLETINAWLMHVLYFKKLQLHVFHRVHRCMYERQTIFFWLDVQFFRYLFSQYFCISFFYILLNRFPSSKLCVGGYVNWGKPVYQPCVCIYAVLINFASET
jgi:hypothetical protein